MVKMLADKYGLIHCGENYDCVPESIKTPEEFSGLCYFQTMKNWQEFINRTPDEYAKWIDDTAREVEQFEIAYLIRISHSQKVIVDTNIHVDVLREIADYNQVAIMLSPQSMSVEHFFNRDDQDKSFLMAQIMEAENPQKTLENFRSCMAKVNNQDVYDEFANSGFFTIVRETAEIDTKKEVLEILAKHFGLENSLIAM
jgi:hypothetical protein